MRSGSFHLLGDGMLLRGLGDQGLALEPGQHLADPVSAVLLQGSVEVHDDDVENVEQDHDHGLEPVRSQGNPRTHKY